MAQVEKVKRTTSKFSPGKVTCKRLWQLISAENEGILFSKLLTFLQGGLWFARLDTFESSVPEGKLPSPNIGLLRKVLGEKQSEMAAVLYDKAVLRSFASCWHMSDDMPSCYAWCQFGGGGNGIAIGTRPKTLEKWINGQMKANEVCFGKVSYINHRLDQIKDGNLIEPAFCVQDGYRRENEARLLILTSSVKDPLAAGPYGRLVQKEEGPEPQGYSGGHAEGKAIVAPFGKQHLVIVIGDGVSESTQTRLNDLCEKYNFPQEKIFPPRPKKK